MTKIIKAQMQKPVSTDLHRTNHAQVQLLTIAEDSEGQRIDNYLAKTLKGVPKSHIYRILRSGEVRLNGKRVDASDKVVLGDVVRIPPIRATIKSNEAVTPTFGVAERFKEAILFEDEALLVLNKPAGMAVHGGSGISRGVIEQLRAERPKAKFLELVHRLDRETSGVLLVAKKRAALVALHDAIKFNKTDKRYLMLVKGLWTEKTKRVELPLHKFVLPNGERRVVVQADGQHSETYFTLRSTFANCSLLEARLVTGRTHQLRVQLAHLGFPILGDDRYGDFELNKKLQKAGLKRMFLHSCETRLKHPVSNQPLRLVAPLPDELKRYLDGLEEQLT